MLHDAENCEPEDINLLASHVRSLAQEVAHLRLRSRFYYHADGSATLLETAWEAVERQKQAAKHLEALYGAWKRAEAERDALASMIDAGMSAPTT